MKLERWRGLPHINKVKQYATVLCFKVLFVYLVMKIDGLDEDLSSLIKMSSPKLHIAPLKSDSAFILKQSACKRTVDKLQSKHFLLWAHTI